MIAVVGCVCMCVHEHRWAIAPMWGERLTFGYQHLSITVLGTNLRLLGLHWKHFTCRDVTLALPLPLMLWLMEPMMQPWACFNLYSAWAMGMNRHALLFAVSVNMAIRWWLSSWKFLGISSCESPEFVWKSAGHMGMKKWVFKEKGHSETL